MTDTANANPTDAPRSTAQIHAEFASAGFLRRLAAMIYDVLVAVAIIMLASALALGCAALLTSLGWLELPAGMDHAAWLNQSMFYQIYLLLVLGGFFGWFWWRSGQTIGMRAWRLKSTTTQRPPDYQKQALIRVLTCCFGLGNLWVLVDFKHRRAWHDYAAGTELVTLSKEANQLYYWKEL